MNNLLTAFMRYQNSILALILFIIVFFLTSLIIGGGSTNAFANGDYGTECPDVNVTCDCTATPCNCPCPPAAKMRAEEPSEKSAQFSGGLRLGYHAYTANEFLNDLPNLDQSAFNSPSGDQPFPPIEGEFNVSILPLKYFSVSALLGTYLGKVTNSNDVLSKTQTVYFLAMPRFDYSFDFKIEDVPITISPYIGAGIGFAYFTFWQDEAVNAFPPPDAIDESHVVFAYSPSVGFSVPLLAVEPSVDIDGLPTWIDKARLKLLIDYRYIGAVYKSFNAGGHLFLVGLGMDF